MLVFRAVDISDSELVTFSRQLGEVVVGRTGEHEHPEIATITLDPSKTDAVLAWYRQGNFLWHIDGATDELPQKATLLTAREVDESGGDTEFASTYVGYEALPETEKAQILDLQVVHSFANAQLRAHPDASDGSALVGTVSRRGSIHLCGPTATAGDHSCSAPPRPKWSAGLRMRERPCLSDCSSGRPDRSSRFATTGTEVTWSFGTIPGCCTGPFPSSRLRVA